MRAIVLALCLCSVVPVQAQQPTETPPASSSPSVQSTQIPGGDKPKAANDQKHPAAEVPVLNPAQPPQDQKPGGDRADSSDGVRADKGEHESYERTIANFTIALAVATFLLMVATGGLWWETRKLATQAVEASKDTKQSIGIAERSAEAAIAAANSAAESLATERAWMIFQTINAIPARNAMIGAALFDRVIGIQVLWNNSGRTPAINVRNHAQLRLIGADEGIPLFELPPEFFEAAHGVIGPSHPSGSGPCGVSIQDVERMQRGEIKIVIYAANEYETIFSNEKRRSEVCGLIEYQGHARGEDGEMWPSISFRLVGNQNSVT